MILAVSVEASETSDIEAREVSETSEDEASETSSSSSSKEEEASCSSEVSISTSILGLAAGFILAASSGCSTFMLVGVDGGSRSTIDTGEEAAELDTIDPVDAPEETAEKGDPIDTREDDTPEEDTPDVQDPAGREEYTDCAEDELADASPDDSGEEENLDNGCDCWEDSVRVENLDPDPSDGWEELDRDDKESVHAEGVLAGGAKAVPCEERLLRGELPREDWLHVEDRA